MSEQSIRLSHAKNSKYVLEIYKNNRWFALESKYRGTEDAEMHVQHLGEANLYLIFGVGSLVFLEKLKNENPKSFVLIFEPDIVISTFIQKETSLLNGNNISIFHKIDILLSRFAELFSFSLGHTYKIWANPQYKVLFTDSFQVWLNNIEAFIQNLLNDYKTQAYFGTHWLYCIKQNVSNLNNSINPRDILKKSKVTIIGAGPSLSRVTLKNDSFNNNKDVIVADTMMPFMRAHDLFFTSAYSIDASFFSTRHLQSIKEKIPCMLLDLCSNPILARSSQYFSFVQGNHPLIRLLLNDYLQQIALYSSGNVGHAMVEWAIQANYKEILVYGLDFSYAQSHPYAKPVFLEKEFMSDSNRLSPLSMKYEKLWLDDGLRDTKGIIETTRLAMYKQNFQSRLDFYYKNGFIESYTEMEHGNYLIINNVSKNKNFTINTYSANKIKAVLHSIKNLYKLLYTEAEHANTWFYSTDLRRDIIISIMPQLAALQRRYLLESVNPIKQYAELIKKAATLTLDALAYIEVHL